MSSKTKAELEMENEELRSALEGVYDRVSGALGVEEDEEDFEDEDEDVDDE